MRRFPDKRVLFFLLSLSISTPPKFGYLNSRLYMYHIPYHICIRKKYIYMHYVQLKVSERFILKSIGLLGKCFVQKNVSTNVEFQQMYQTAILI